MSEQKSPERRIKKPLPVFTGLGIALGCGLGVATDNLPIVVGAGTAIGIAIGIIMKKRNEKQDSDQ